jgi:RNA polymerase sigma-32 factor
LNAMVQLSGVGRQFIRTAMAAPFLARDEEQVLARRWKDEGNVGAMHQLAQAHMRLVIALAVKFRHYGLPIADLIQEGHIGLLEAAMRFEPEREVRFSTYATWWIRAAIQDYVLRNWSIVRGGTSSAQKSLFFNLRRLRAKLAQRGESSNAIVYEDIAQTLGVNRADVEMMDMRLSGPDISLNATVAESDPSMPAERVDFLVDDKPLPDELVSSSIDTTRRTDWLEDALKSLTERELSIVRERRLGEEATTLEALGARLGISKERVRQIESRAIEKLRRYLLQRHPEDAAGAMI